MTTHIARYDQMSKYKHVPALIGNEYGHHTKDDSFNKDIIGLHVTDLRELYEPDKIQSTESKPTAPR